MPSPDRAPTSDPDTMTAAYDRSGTAWQAGPSALIYDRLAEVLVARSPVPLDGRLVLDVGAGTGAAGRALASAGAVPISLDTSAGMLRADPNRARAAAADAVRLPTAATSVDGVVASFSFTHLRQPVVAFREAGRVCRPGSPLLVSTYAGDDHHPAKDAVARALTEVGWVAPSWYQQRLSRTNRPLATIEALEAVAGQAGLEGRAEHVRVDVEDLTPRDLTAWRLALAHVAPFFARLDPAERCRVVERAHDLLGADPPPLQRSILVFAGVTGVTPSPRRPTAPSGDPAPHPSLDSRAIL